VLAALVVQLGRLAQVELAAVAAVVALNHDYSYLLFYCLIFCMCK
jgi:hypothetical protein